MNHPLIILDPGQEPGGFKQAGKEKVRDQGEASEGGRECEKRGEGISEKKKGQEHMRGESKKVEHSDY